MSVGDCVSSIYLMLDVSIEKAIASVGETCYIDVGNTNHTIMYHYMKLRNF